MRAVAAWLIVAAVLYCAPLFSNLNNWGRQDWDQFTFRYETPRLSLLQDHALPAWNPYASGGTVLLAHPDSPVLSPWYLIVLIAGAPIGLRVQVVFFMAVGAIGMAALARRLGASTLASAAAGIVFMMSSHFALHITEGHLEWTPLGLMPWLALGLLRDGPIGKGIVGLALLLASVLMFGAVYIPAVFLPFISIWIVLTAIRDRRWQPVAKWGGVLALALLLSAVKLVPTLAFTGETRRDVGIVQKTEPLVLATGLFEPRQALFYQSYRDQAVPDGHFAKAIPNHSAMPIVAQLTGLGANEGFHEYGGYISIVGIVLAVWGLIHTARRFWPLYVAGLCALVVTLGAASFIDLWTAMRQLPLYNQLQVPSRFLAAVVFVLAIATAFGLDAATASLRGRWQRWQPAVAALLVAAIYVELCAMGWTLFSDVFVVPPVAFERHAGFAHRFPDRFATGTAEADDGLLMESEMYGHMISNSGTLDAYENLSVAKGHVRATSDPSYRGEVYLESQRGSATIQRWTMSRIEIGVAPTGSDDLILNQNFHRGWQARRTRADGSEDVIPAVQSKDGLISIAVGHEYRSVEAYYEPPGFMLGVLLSGLALVLCQALVLRDRARGVA